MTRRDDSDDAEDRDGPDAEEPRGLIRSLLALLQEMEEAGERTRTGHSRPRPNTSVDYSISIGGLFGPDERDPFGTGDARSDETSLDAHVTTRETPEGLVVVADIPGVEADDVDTRIDPDEQALVIRVAGRDATRLPLQSDGWTVVDSRFANGVLEVSLRRG